MTRALILAALALSGCMSSPPTRLVDHGGAVDSYIAAVQAERGQPVRPVPDVCESACTLYLATRCVKPDTVLRFHGPSSQIYGVGLDRETWDRTSRQMAAFYPPGIRAKFLAEWRHVTVGMVTISGREAVALGAKEC